MAEMNMPEHFGQQPKASPAVRTWTVILGFILLAIGIVAILGSGMVNRRVLEFAGVDADRYQGFAFGVGVPVGLLVGYHRSWISTLVMRVFDFVQSFPVFVLGMALVSVMGQEIWNVAIVLAILFTPIFALSRTVGWISQWKEMLSDPQNKIGRPRQLYIGATKRDYVGVDNR